MPLEGDPFAIAKALLAGEQVEADNPKAKAVLEAATKAKLTGGRSGAVYTVLFFTDRAGRSIPYGSRPPHHASAPGEAPAMDSGNLLALMVIKAEHIPAGALVSIESHADYSRYLEFGTSRMAPRPFIRPITREQLPVLLTLYASGIVSRERAMARALGGRG